LVGKPDFIFHRERVAIFVDGCFWHGCPTHYKAPSTRSSFWRTKVNTNRARDLRVAKALRRQGWRVLRIWEHELVPGRSQKTVERIRRALS
jgi:DNA mismatch endonuclease (patch repair protein)